MQQFNIHEAKTRLSSLIDGAAKGRPFIIAKAGKPMVKVVPVSYEEVPARRVGFMAGQFAVPADFNSMGKREIEGLFGGSL
ncbi:MAG: type II toxin-antitoxin system prevent-host-death family antitoxin [Chitinispirillales bacterium]|nr:type II toxin-antitoxin system prevent-host-death family antitoxin [Chitinispirillales bacterium]